ncbi:MAG: ATP-binding cassette domain-containing protein [Clostridia bacterium]|nr:ATP-binding cassette domain-containing protein [Clostridia bacterium]
MTLKIENGVFAYDKSRTVLNKVNLEAQSGDLIAVLGPNGAGKTTMLRCMMGFLKWHEGKSTLDGENIREIPQKKLWQKIAYVPQARNVTASYTCEEMILLGRSSHLSTFAKPKEEDILKVRELAKQMHIEKLLNKKCSQISGGELQMVLIARALAADPQILILDEPESNLDFKNQLIVLETMSKLANSGMTCIFNTHYPAHALQRANKSFILCRDGSYMFGRTRDVVTEENIEKAFGVKAVIGEIETDSNVVRNVIPLSVAKRAVSSLTEELEQNEENGIAVVSLIFNNSEFAEKINGILHTYNKYLVGRMGMPYRKAGVNIINITMDAPKAEIQRMCDELARLGVSVKATFAK